MHVQPFLSVFQPAHTHESNSHPGCIFSHSCQWFWSTQALESNSQARCKFTHSCQSFWSSQTLERNSLSGCAHPFSWVILVYSKTGETHLLDVCSQWFWSTQKLERLTCWMHVHPFSSVLLICSNTGSYSLPGCKFSHSHQCSNPLIHMRATHSLNTCSAIFVSGSDLLNPQRATHILNVFSIYLINRTQSHFLQSYQIALQEIVIRFHQFSSWTPHTYCQYSISLIFMVILLHSHSAPLVNLRWHKLKS